MIKLVNDLNNVRIYTVDVGLKSPTAAKKYINGIANALKEKGIYNVFVAVRS